MKKAKFILLAFLISLNFLPLNSLSATYPIKPGNDLVGKIFMVNPQEGENLSELAQRYNMSLPEMMEANPNIQPDVPLSKNDKIIVPAQFILPTFRQGIVINIGELRLYYFTPDGKTLITYPVALGREGWRTPITSTLIIRKTANPAWRPPASIRQAVYKKTGKILPKTVPPGPHNPLGAYALYLGMPGYLIHGTNQPESIGRFISSGCIRMNSADIQDLYYRVEVGTEVKIIHSPYKAGWAKGELYLEAQRPLGEKETPQISWKSIIEQKTAGNLIPVDWQRSKEVALQHSGIPQIISKKQCVMDSVNYLLILFQKNNFSNIL